MSKREYAVTTQLMAIQNSGTYCLYIENQEPKNDIVIEELFAEYNGEVAEGMLQIHVPSAPTQNANYSAVRILDGYSIDMIKVLARQWNFAGTGMGGETGEDMASLVLVKGSNKLLKQPFVLQPGTAIGFIVTPGTAGDKVSFNALVSVID